MKEMKEDALEAFEDMRKALEEEDIEMVESYHLDEDATDECDVINELVFRKFNDKITNDEIEAIVKKFESPYDYATFKIVFILDVIIVFAYI